MLPFPSGNSKKPYKLPQKTLQQFKSSLTRPQSDTVHKKDKTSDRSISQFHHLRHISYFSVTQRPAAFFLYHFFNRTLCKLMTIQHRIMNNIYLILMWIFMWTVVFGWLSRSPFVHISVNHESVSSSFPLSRSFFFLKERVFTASSIYHHFFSVELSCVLAGLKVNINLIKRVGECESLWTHYLF